MEKLLKEFTQERNDIDELLSKALDENNVKAILHHSLSMQIKNDCIRIIKAIKL